MSILLEALKKSERQQRRGTIPDLNSPEDPPVSVRSAWRRPGWAALALVVLLVVGYGFWRSWTVTGPGAAPAPAPQRETVASASDTATPASDSVRVDRQPRSPVEGLSGERPHQSARPAAPVASRPAPRATKSAETETSETPEPRRKADIVGTVAADDTPEALARAVAALRQAAREPDAGTRGGQPDRSATPAGAADDASAAPERDDTGLISLWQLPADRRSALPEFRISVLAWDADPARRFIVMGGKRFGEGDTVAARLTLEEIRRDRAVFRNGPYRFYVSQ